MSRQHRRPISFIAALLLAALGFALSASPAGAKWPTTQFVPVPAGETASDRMSDEFSGFRSGGSGISKLGGYKALTVGKLDLNKFRNGAHAALVDLMGRVQANAMKMEAAGFAAPAIEPLLISKHPKARYYPIFWANLPKGDNFHWACYTHSYASSASKAWYSGHDIHYYINARNAGWTKYETMDAAWRAGGDHRRRFLAVLSTQLTHEVVHAVQQGFDQATNSTCRDDPKWWSEGTADGVAYFLSEMHYRDLFNGICHHMNVCQGVRDVRRYDIPLDVRRVPASERHDYNYGTGSFFRYLFEAAGPPAASLGSDGGKAGLSLARDILRIQSLGKARSTNFVLKIDRIIKNHSGRKSGLYATLPEFLTELASYGHARYKDRKAVGWIEEMFHGCRSVTVGPGAQSAVVVEVKPLAGECIKVHYAFFKTPTALQMKVTSDGQVDFGSLHLGEAFRKGQGMRTGHFCYDVTKKIDHRLTHDMNEKCILKREPYRLNSPANGSWDVASWTSDFNAYGSGDVYYVLTDVAKDVRSTRPYKLKFHVGALEIKETEGKTVTPQKPGGEKKPVEHGMTDMKKRVYAMTAPGGKALLDGRDIISGAQQNQVDSIVKRGGNRASAAIVFSGQYWVMFGWPKKGTEVARHGDLAMIIKNPHRFGGSGMGLVSSAGASRLDKGGKCGYETPAKVDVIEKSRKRLAFRVSGDLFDFGKIMGIDPNASTCDKLKQMWVEHASFEVALPNGTLYGPKTVVKTAHPPGQEIYDKEFLPGPNFGGIATSKSLQEEGPPPTNRWAPGGGPSTTPQAPASAGTSGAGMGAGMAAMGKAYGGQMKQMTKRVCKMMTQSRDMAHVPAQMVPMMMQSIKGMHCGCAIAARMKDPAHRKDFSPALRKAVLADAGHCGG